MIHEHNIIFFVIRGIIVQGASPILKVCTSAGGRIEYLNSSALATQSRLDFSCRMTIGLAPGV